MFKNSPYKNVPVNNWKNVTENLIKKYPVSTDYLVSVVLRSWDDILKTKIAGKLSIAKDVQPKPQIMGFLLHEVIEFTMQADYPQLWRREQDASDKDVVCLKDDIYSLEIKTSSDKKHIFGNRSYAQETSSSKKSKSSFYLAINFEKFENNDSLPRIRLIRFGWIDHEDWIGQAAASGQQSRLSKEVEEGKLLTIYDISSK